MLRNFGIICAAILILGGIVYGAFYRIIDIGFLLDDFKHLGYSYYFWNGDQSGVWKTFTGNWSGQSDGLTSYRPGISMTFAFDYLVWKFNAAGYHLTNLIVYTFCAFFCSVIAYQVTVEFSRKERLWIGFFAGLLFALYPIHAESVSWVVGRVDIHCTFLYMLSMLTYFQFRKNENYALLGVSLVSFYIALICKEMAVTLPAVLACAEVLLPGPLQWKRFSFKKRGLVLGIFLVSLVAFGLFRTALLGTVVGGYGTTDLRSTVRYLKNFLDVPTFRKILFGVNEEAPFPNHIIQIAYYAWMVLGVTFVARLTQPLSRLRIWLFLILWLVVSEIPTFQIWHVYPNLVGSRLFFLGSAALCVLVSVALVGSYKAGSKFSNPKFKLAMQTMHILCLVSLVVLSGCWYMGLQHNQFAWIEAGRQMRALQSQLIAETRTLPPDGSLVLIDLPQDFSGSGLIGRPEYLIEIFNRPYQDADYARRMLTLARPVPGPNEYVYPNLLERLYLDRSATKWFHWSKDDRGFVQWTKPQGTQALALDVTNLAESKVENLKAPTCVWLSKALEIDPFAVDCIEVSLDGKPDLKELARNARLVWRSKKQPKSWIDYSEGPWAEVIDDKLVFLPGRYRSWTLNGTVEDIGIQFFPGDYSVSIQSVRNIPEASLMPSNSLVLDSTRHSSASDLIMPFVKSSEPLSVSFDASKIAGATKVTLFVTRTDFACPDLPTKVLPEDLQGLFKQQIDSTAGTFKLPQSVMDSAGKHQITLLALDAEGRPVGFTSEPLTFFVQN